MRALYDLSKYITSFNFFEWLLYAQTRGATRVVFSAHTFKAAKWPLSQVKRRFESILLPGPALAGMTYEMGHDGVGFGNPSGALAVAAWRSGRMRRLQSVKPKGTERYTVTLRKTPRANGRDSDEAAWREFADEIGARVIPDYDVEPIHLHDRVALYAGAEMNFFVSNGPGILCSFTEYPCMIFDTHLAAGSLASDGILGHGAQYPWMVKNQYAIWEPATLPNIRKHFYAWTGGNYDPNDVTAA